MVDLTVRTYDPSKIIITLGPIIVSGYADGTFVSIERNGPLFEKVRGADGAVDRVNKNATDFTVTITLKQTSPTNNAFSALVLADLTTNSGALPLMIKDTNGTSLFAAAQAWIATEATAEESSDLSTREWVIETGPAANLIGSN